MDQAKYSVYFGRLGRNPELRRTQEGGVCLRFFLSDQPGKRPPPHLEKNCLLGRGRPAMLQEVKQGK